MAGSVSLTTLRARVRKRADVEGETARHTNAEVDQYINDAWDELFDLIASVNEEFYISTNNITTVAGTSVYALPATFYYLRSAVAIINGIRYELNRFDLSEIDELFAYGSSYAGAPAGYTFIGDNLQILPTPSSVYTVEIRFIPLPTDMVAGSDTINGRAGWEDFVVWQAAAKIKAIDNRDPSIQIAQADRQRQRVLEAAQRRNLHQPKSIIRRDKPRLWWRGIRRIV